MKKFCFLFIILFIVACSDDVLDNPGMDIESKSYQGKSHKISERQAINNIMAHFALLQSDARSRGESVSTPSVENIEVIRSRDLGIDSIKCLDLYETVDTMYKKFGDNDKVFLDTLFYIVNFQDKKGWAILAADDRTDPIYAIIDEGNYHVDSLRTEQNDGLLYFLDNSINTELSDVSRFLKAPGIHHYYWHTIPDNWDCDFLGNVENKWERKDPILVTRWGQYSPYNLYCPNRYPTGCTITAVAQILSYYQTIEHVAWQYKNDKGETQIDWTNVIDECRMYNGKLFTSKYSRQIAHLMRYLGISFDADYKNTGTEVIITKPIEWLNKSGGIKATKLENFKASKVKNAIKAGNLVYARGNSSRTNFKGIRPQYSGGHAWVCDGYIYQYGYNIAEKFYFHCNWGWNGDFNGYFLSKAFDTNNAYEYDEGCESIGGSNFKYNNQCSILSKK